MVGGFLSLALTKIFDSSKHVSRYSFLVFDNLLHNNCFGETLLNAFRHNCSSCPIQQSLFAVTERVARNVSKPWVPDVVSATLLARTPVSVCFLVHLLDLCTLLEAASCGTDCLFSLLGLNLILYTESLVFYFFRPHVTPAISHA